MITPVATIGLSACPDAYITTLVALISSLRYVGGAIGYSIYYSVFTAKIAAKLPTYVAEYAIKAGLPLASAKDFVTIFLTEPTKIATVKGVTADVIGQATLGAKFAYADSLKYVWWSSLPFGVICCVACVFIGSNKAYLTGRIAAVRF